MKVLFILTISILSFNFQAFTQKPKPSYKWPGFVQINDSVFIGTQELSIQEYAEFLTIMKIFFGSYDQFEKALPNPMEVNWITYDPFQKQLFSVGQLYEVLDSTRINIKHRGKSNLDKNVAYLPYIRYLPIVNITKEQALIYCEFRSKAFSTLKQNTRKKKGWALPDSVYFRLPTIAEWTLAFEDKQTNTSKEDYRNTKGKNLIVSKGVMDSLYPREHIPAGINYGYINSKGIVNMCGNVAEILMDSTLAIGGSFKDNIPDCLIPVWSETKPPQEHIGFRVVAVIVK